MSQRTIIQGAVCRIESALRNQGIEIHPDSVSLEHPDQKAGKARRISAFDELMRMSDEEIVEGLGLTEFKNFVWTTRLEGENTNIRYMCW